jgi:uncharacterized protein
MILSEAKYLLDVNVLVALADKNHVHNELVTRWFDGMGRASWGVCPFTEAGFLRVVTRLAIGALSIEEATEILTRFAKQPGYTFWPIMYPWSDLASALEGRIFGHQQITDACLLGLAIKESGVLVTLDKAIGHLAGTQFSRNLLVLE